MVTRDKIINDKKCRSAETRSEESHLAVPASMDDPFRVLGLTRGQCTEADIKKAYKALAMKHHPDKAGPAGEDKFKELQNAYEKIMSKKLWQDTEPTSPSDTFGNGSRTYQKHPRSRYRAAHSPPRSPLSPERDECDEHLKRIDKDNRFFAYIKEYTELLLQFAESQISDWQPSSTSAGFRRRTNVLLTELIMLQRHKKAGAPSRARICHKLGKVFDLIKLTKVVNATRIDDAIKIDKDWSFDKMLILILANTDAGRKRKLLGWCAEFSEDIKEGWDANYHKRPSWEEMWVQAYKEKKH